MAPLSPLNPDNEMPQSKAFDKEILKQIRARMAFLEGEPAPMSDEQFYDMHNGVGQHQEFHYATTGSAPKTNEEKAAEAANKAAQDNYDEDYASIVYNQILDQYHCEMEYGPNCVCNRGRWAPDVPLPRLLPTLRQPKPAPAPVPRTQAEIAEHERISREAAEDFLGGRSEAVSTPQQAVADSDTVMNEGEQVAVSVPKDSQDPTSSNATATPQQTAEVPDTVMSEADQVTKDLEEPTTTTLPQQSPPAQAQEPTVNHEEKGQDVADNLGNRLPLTSTSMPGEEGVEGEGEVRDEEPATKRGKKKSALQAGRRSKGSSGRKRKGRK